MKQIEQLIEISRKYGSDSRYVIAGGGNTSYKDDKQLWVKASGHALATITEEGFAVLDRVRLNAISTNRYSDDSDVAERQVACDLAAACLNKGARPSVETSLHNAMSARFVVHLHPSLVCGLVSSMNAESECARLFGDKALYVPYADPGYALYKRVSESIAAYEATHGCEPKVVLLQNHGIFVGADSTAEIEQIYDEVFATIEQAVREPLPEGEVSVCDCVSEVVPALRMMLSRGDDVKTLKVTTSPLVQWFSESETNFAKVAAPFSPDGIIYCRSKYLYIAADTTESILAKAEQEIEEFNATHGYMPKVVVMKGVGLIAVGANAKECGIITDVFTDAMKVAWLAQSFGGEHPMSAEQIRYVDNWEAHRPNFKSAYPGRVENKIFIITGAAQGFGEGIAKCLMGEGANIVVADLNEQTGNKTVSELNAVAKSNRATFVKTDVSDLDNLNALIKSTVCAFGGLDVFVCNAGIVRAGGIETMTPENFELVTRINYNAYFYCVKVASRVMKLQNRYSDENWGDIIQINSKSGLRGSKANFTYAGSKFGGIGLTQSFALELAPERIKVNSICPGNFYDGPLWSDPVNGLFLQYLNAGKIPGAKTVEDVREYYISQAPMRKGCSPSDVCKAVLYLIEQTCETGQALPITGGQVMLN
jgi:rhamnose utilization protein RhaD (predicted bifunctional aldolase and dehydrogenase)/NAD(P)-dependent dehydrogenase (short-subunit alcohol dehydrogenase family)